MKKIIFILCLCAITVSSFAQDSTKTAPRYKNEFGVDVTGFLKQFVYLNGTSFPEYYTPVYFVTYRRHIGRCNLRAAIGGSYYHQPFDSPFANDPNTYQRTSYQLSARIGWEWTNEIARRWQMFYGVDYRQGMMYDHNDAPFWNGGYANGVESTTNSYGIAPLIGFRFRLTERISISSEASLLFAMGTTETRRYYLSVDPAMFPPVPDYTSPKVKSFSTSFAQPLSVFFTVDI